ncbi:MAG: SCO family protein [Blastocatellia bacterium]|nr:SCO family protein [Blastocatellia bacterium]
MINTHKFNSYLPGRAGKLILIVAAISLCAYAGRPHRAQDAHQHHNHTPPAKETEEKVSVGNMAIPDVVLLNQNGEPVRIYSDLIKGHVVAINTIFTTCTTICPPMGANFSRLQKLMGDRMDKDIRLISISVDPVTDTPQRLKAWSEKFDAGPGWTLLTGPKQEVDKLLKALKVFAADKWDHAPTVLVGSETSGEWTRAYGLASPSKLAEIITGVIEQETRKSPSKEDHRK